MNGTLRLRQIFLLLVADVATFIMLVIEHFLFGLIGGVLSENVHLCVESISTVTLVLCFVIINAALLLEFAHPLVKRFVKIRNDLRG